MNLNSIRSNLTSKADVIGAMYGGLVQRNGLTSIISSLQQMAAGVIHAPDPIIVQNLLGSPEIKNAIYAYVGGEVIKALNLPYIGKYGDAIQKAAAGFGLAFSGVQLLHYMTHSEIKGVNIENTMGDSTLENFNNAPLLAALSY
jgi:hypothetical protein